VISYRYHLVSVIGVFLALALGVVIGTSALNGAVVGDLHRQVSDLKDTNAATSAKVRTLQARAGDAELIAKNFAAKLLGGALAKTAVVIVGAPGASGDLKDAVAADVVAAGGTVSTRIQLSKDFFDPKRASDIRSLATSGAHPIGLQLPTADNAGSLSGALLGYVLLGKGQQTDLTQVLTGFSTLNLLKNESTGGAAGKVIVVVAPGTAPTGSAQSKGFLSMAAELASTGPTVVAGDAASNSGGGAVATVRGDATADPTMTTVDDVDSALGQLTTALAAKEALAGRDGRFGTGAGVDALLPGVTS
jgi:hypothetical protein